MKKLNRHKVSKCLEKTTLFYERYPEFRFTGFHEYHMLPNHFTTSVNIGGRVGVEIELDFPRNPNGRSIFVTCIDSNILWCSKDGSLTGVSPMEICTVPLLKGDAIAPAFWKPITTRLVELGGRSYRDRSTGLHVHVDRREFYPKDATTTAKQSYAIQCARALYGLYVQNSAWKLRLFGRLNNNYAKNNIGGEILKFIQTTLPEAVHSKECVEKLIKDAREGSDDRYSEFNVKPTTTVEFRCGKGTLNPDRIATIAEFCLLFAKYCKMFGKRIAQTSQKHFEKFMVRHSKANSPLKAIFQQNEEE